MEEGVSILSVGERLRELRLSANMTLQQQGKLFDVSVNSVYRWEHNLNIPRLWVLKEIADYYKVPLEWLCDGNKEDANCEHNPEDIFEHQLLKIYRELSDRGKLEAFVYAESLYFKDLAQSEQSIH